MRKEKPLDYIKSESFKHQPCSSATEEIIQAVGRYNRALKSGNLESVMACFAEDVVLIPEQQQPVVGIEAVRRVYESLFQLIRFNNDNVIHIVDAQAGLDMGFVRSHETRGSVLELASGAQHHPHFRELWMLKKDSANHWKITVYAYGIPSKDSHDPANAVVW